MRALSDEEHAAIILFSLMIGGMVGIITRNGGMASIVRKIFSRARSAIGGQTAVWGMGLDQPAYTVFLKSIPYSFYPMLAGADWGDHCSPISDTTVLSSMASGCGHIEHVRT